jgi:RNA polymerase sigma factor (TIGR02999 family)
LRVAHTPVILRGVSDVTRILRAIDEGDPRAADRLLPLVYDELRHLAAQRLAHEAAGQTFQPTDRVHEAYLRLVDVEHAQCWNGRGHFFAAAAEAMRRILVEHARHKQSLKRGGNRQRVALADVDQPGEPDPAELLAIDDALTRLAAEDATAAAVVKLRYFAGLSVEDAADSLSISRATAYRHWTYARAWLHNEIRRSDEPAS